MSSRFLAFSVLFPPARTTALHSTSHTRLLGTCHRRWTNPLWGPSQLKQQSNVAISCRVQTGNSPLLSSPFRRLPLNRAITPRSSKGLTAVRGREGGPFSRPEKRKGRTSGTANIAFCRGRSRSARDWLQCSQGHSDTFFFQE